MKFALLSVSYAGLFYAGKPLSLEEQVYKAKQLGFDGLAIETKRPVACPIDLSKADRGRIKAAAADQGISLCAVESMSNFTSRYMEERENNLAMMRYVLDLASDLGVDMVKVFAAWPGLVNDEEAVAMYAQYERGNHFKRPYPPDLRKWHRALDGIREVAGWAGDMGITLVLQNHAPVTTPGYEDALAMVQEIDRRNVNSASTYRCSMSVRIPRTCAMRSIAAANTSSTRITGPGISLRRRTAASCRGRRRHLAARSITKRSSRRCRRLATRVISRPNIVCRW
jgi:sugar phosphate isomerase/epimerase